MNILLFGTDVSILTQKLFFSVKLCLFGIFLTVVKHYVTITQYTL